MTKTAAITSHYNTPVKSFAACLGGESVAGMIHRCSVSQTTDRPSPAHCSSESQINWPDTSNDSAWKRRYGSQTQIHTCTFGKKKKKKKTTPDECHKQSRRSRWCRRPIWLLIGVFVSTGELSLWGSPLIFLWRSNHPSRLRNMWNSWAPYWLMCFPLSLDWVKL